VSASSPRWPILSLGVAAAGIAIAFLLAGIDPLWALPIILCLGIAVLGGVEIWELRRAPRETGAEPRSEDRFRELAG
jgi:hypothetical protein